MRGDLREIKEVGEPWCTFQGEADEARMLGRRSRGVCVGDTQGQGLLTECDSGQAQGSDSAQDEPGKERAPAQNGASGVGFPGSSFRGVRNITSSWS